MRNKVIEKLKQYNQEHLLQFENELTDEEKSCLYQQILETDFSYLSKMNEKIIKDNIEIEPIPSLKYTEISNQISQLESVGIKSIQNNEVAVLLLAGGMGTRLGSDNPKGMYNIGKTKDVYIFQCLFENLLKVVKQAGTPIPFFIMTSEKNNESTISFLKQHNYFGYDQDYIRFFVQDMAPCVNSDGKILLEEKYRLATSPNGNGGWFNSLLKNSDSREMLEKFNIQWINVVGVDNVLQKIADPVFIGGVISGDYNTGSKVIRKVNPTEKVGLMCNKNGVTSVIEYTDMPEDKQNLKNENGELAFGLGIVLNYLFNVKQLHKIKDTSLPVHVVYKKVNHIDNNGTYKTPSEPNAYKFEYLCVDMIELCGSCLPYEVLRNKEFAPIKNKEGVDSVATAQALLEENGYIL